MHRHIFKPTQKQSAALRNFVKNIASLSGSNFENILEIGRHLDEAKATLGRGKGVAGYWLNWIETDVGLERRVGQTCHKMYLKFAHSSEKRIAKVAIPYLAKIGPTKLERILALNTKLGKKKKTYKGPVTAVSLDKTITLTVKKPGDKKAKKLDLADIKLKDLNKLINPKVKGKGNKKGDVVVSKSTSVDDVVKMDYRKIDDLMTLRKICTIYKNTHLQSQKGDGYIKHKMAPAKHEFDFTYSDATKPKRARKALV